MMKAEPQREPAAMHGRWLSRGSHKGAATAAATLGTSAGSIQQADGGDATSSLVFIQAATGFAVPMRKINYITPLGF